MQLRPYQDLARRHILSTPRCALWAGMGMGKTTSTLHALADLMMIGDTRRTLVLGPKRVARDVWRDEVEKWPALRGMRVTPIIGTVEQRRRALVTPSDIWTINYENIPWLVQEMKGKWWFDTVVADESSKLRGFRLKQGAARPRALAPFAHTKIERFIQLTGTPAANSLTALWGQAWFLDAGQRLGRSFEAFKERWFASYGDPESAQLKPLPFAEQQIIEALADICLTLRPQDWFDLDEPIRNEVVVHMPPTAQRIYKTFKKDLYIALTDGKVTSFNAAARTAKLLQLAAGAVYVDEGNGKWEVVHDAKLEALESIVEEASTSVLVGYQFVSDKARILKHFGARAVDLATTEGLRAFKAGKAEVGVAHPASMGHGIDGLQNVCNVVAFFSNVWDAELRAQLIERVGPMRQKQAGFERPVFIYDIVAEGTIDSVVLARHATKKSIQDALLEAMVRDVDGR